jgi:hypothetical protein
MESVDEARAQLKVALRDARKPVVVLVDDIDRLERDELHAVLRMLRLVSDLPGLSHVLAYDRLAIRTLLFPDDPSGRVARDYLAKIVDVELSIATPTPEAVDRLLGPAIQPLLDTVDQATSQQFVTRLNLVPRQVFLEVLATPREVRRVVLATAIVWSTLSRDLNLFDLFVLRVIHARYPGAFDLLQTRQEWFANQSWSGNLWHHSRRDESKTEVEKWLTDLKSSGDAADQLLIRLLGLIFPIVKEVVIRPWPTESGARRERRIYHPDVFPRYFQLAVPREQIAESSMEDLAKELLEPMPSALRSSRIAQAIQAAIRDERIDSFFDQWDIFLSALGTENGTLPEHIVRDIALGILQTADQVPARYNDPLNPRSVLTGRLMALLGFLESNDTLSVLICLLIRESPVLELSGDLVRYTTAASKDDRAFPSRQLDERAITKEFDTAVLIRAGRLGNLLELAEGDLAAILYRMTDTGRLSGMIVANLTLRPALLPRLLRFPIKLSVHGPNVDNASVYHDDLMAFDRRVNLKEVHNATSHLPTSHWEDLMDRALVSFFRRRLAEIEEAKSDSRPTTL